MSQDQTHLKQLIKKTIMIHIREAFKAGALHNEYENAFAWDGARPIPDTLEQYMAKIQAEFGDLLD